MASLLTIIVFAALIVGLGASVPFFIFESQSVRNWSPLQQLKAVRTASFKKLRVLNRSELSRFKVIEDEIAAARRGYRVFAQVNLGEILDTKKKSAFWLINSKRVDMLIADREGWPVLAVEYQGEGHYQGDALHRDAIKKVALERAGIGYFEVFPDDSSEQIRARLRKQLGWSAPAQTQRKNIPLEETVPAPHFGRARAT